MCVDRRSLYYGTAVFILACSTPRRRVVNTAEQVTLLTAPKGAYHDTTDRRTNLHARHTHPYMPSVNTPAPAPAPAPAWLGLATSIHTVAGKRTYPCTQTRSSSPHGHTIPALDILRPILTPGPTGGTSSSGYIHVPTHAHCSCPG